MDESRKIVLRETAIVLIGQILCVCLMYVVFWLLKRLDASVLLGGLVGGVLATANFFFMAMGTALAADKAEADNVKGGKALIQMSYLLRLGVLFIILFACAKSGWFHLIALVLPLVFVRPALTVGEFFRKSGDHQK